MAQKAKRNSLLKCDPHDDVKNSQKPNNKTTNSTIRLKIDKDTKKEPKN